MDDDAASRGGIADEGVIDEAGCRPAADAAGRYPITESTHHGR